MYYLHYLLIIFFMNPLSYGCKNNVCLIQDGFIFSKLIAFSIYTESLTNC